MHCTSVLRADLFVIYLLPGELSSYNSGYGEVEKFGSCPGSQANGGERAKEREAQKSKRKIS